MGKKHQKAAKPDKGKAKKGGKGRKGTSPQIVEVDEGTVADLWAGIDAAVVRHPANPPEPDPVSDQPAAVPGDGLNAKERVMLALAWAQQTESVHIAGQAWSAADGWVDRWLLAHHTVGGDEVGRRLRQLVVSGAPIEQRRKPDQGAAGRAVQWRLTSTGPNRKGRR